MSNINRNAALKVDEYYYAYVNYVGPNNDHAFIRILKDINNINVNELGLRDEYNFKLNENCSSIVKNQIIIVRIKNVKHKTSLIHKTNIVGTFLDNQNLTLVDWSSFDEPYFINSVNLRDFKTEASSLYSVKILYLSLELKCMEGDEGISVDNIGFVIRENLDKELQKTEHLNERLLEALRKVSDQSSFQNCVNEHFYNEVENLLDLEDENILSLFITKWKQVDPTLFVYSKMRDHYPKFFFYEKWLENKLPIDFWDQDLIKTFVEYNLYSKEYTQLRDATLIPITDYRITYINYLTRSLLSYFKETKQINSIEEYELYLSIVKLSHSESKLRVITELKSILHPELKFELWLIGEYKGFIKEIAIKRFGACNAADQVRILQELEDEDIVGVLSQLKSISNPIIINRIIKIVTSHILSSFGVISFDIESDTEIIKEIAWNENSSWYYYDNELEVEEGIFLFKNLVESEEGILLGHNIIDFDCPILERHGVSFDNKHLWDTFRMEMLLSPDLNHYALKTQHTAIYDAKFVKSLFINQVYRLLLNYDSLKDSLQHFFAKPLLEQIHNLKQKLQVDWLDKDTLLEERNSYYRPQPKTNLLMRDLEEFMSKSTSINKIILGPDALRYDMMFVPRLSFLAQNELDFRELDKELINTNNVLSDFHKLILKHFIDYRSSLHLKAFWGSLPLAIKLRLENDRVDSFDLVKPLDNSSWNKSEVVFLTADELFEVQDNISLFSEADLFVLQKDLISVTQKTKLKELNLEDFKNLTNDNRFWMKFTGGQSYEPLSKKDCEDLNIEIPSGLTNFWIEKYQFGIYRVWGNYNWEEVRNKIPFNHQYELDIDSSVFERNQVTFARVNLSKNTSESVLRFNPESVYRSRYWVYQKALVDKVLQHDKLNILLIQRKDELRVLESYFRSNGYYIPNYKASLSRRIELLYESRGGKKIIIETIPNLNSILRANYKSELNIILDSFNLTENFYVAQNTSLINGISASKSLNLEKESLGENNSTNEDEVVNFDRKPLVKNNYLLLSLHLPQINHYRNLLHSASPEHTLWILDSRVNDFPGLNKVWNANSIALTLWSENEQYEADVKEAEVHIHSPKPSSNIPFSTEEIKDILSHVFLNGKPWRENQLPYLDLIIPGESNELITLPTGGGKSLLFQGPALLKSAFSNKLTIVITPLKALMEDQAISLWEKGFYGSVEYLNSDRGSDVQVIYRALAGGELSLIFITPERFRSRSFLNALNVRIQSDGGLEYFVFDEAHCISQWGHEFRPDYFNCAKYIKFLKNSSCHETPLLLFSATVSQKIFEDFKMIFS